MNTTDLDLPLRTAKPREHGLTMLIDNGVPLNYFKDLIQCCHEIIDFVKFGWGTATISQQLEEKISYLKEHKINFYFGGTLFEKYVVQNRVDAFYSYCKRYDCQYVEISNGTIPLANRNKAGFIADFAKEFSVLSEVGSKLASHERTPKEWLEDIQQDLEAGAYKVITEARESGTSGICHQNGELKDDLIMAIKNSPIDQRKIIFEAPNKSLQSAFIRTFGTNVNLANIAFSDPIGVETLRLGLRADTLLYFEREATHEGAK